MKGVTGFAQGQQMLLFQAGGRPCAVFLLEVTRLIEESPLLAVPFAHPALAGLLEDGDRGVLPVFDLWAWVDPSRAIRASQTGAIVALFSTERGPIGLRMDVLLGTSTAYQYVDAQAGEWAPMPGLRHAFAGQIISHAKSFDVFSPDGFLGVLDIGQEDPQRGPLSGDGFCEPDPKRRVET
jgi:hypothetical protein